MDATPPPPPPPPSPAPDPYEPPRAATPPPAPARRALSGLAAVGGVMLVLLSCVIGFLATCVPLGFISLSRPVGEEGALADNRPFWGGIIGAIVAGVVTSRLVFGRWRRRIDPPAPTNEAKPR